MNPKHPDGREEEHASEATLAECKRVIERMALRPGMTDQEVLERACATPALEQARLKSLEVKFDENRPRKVKVSRGEGRCAVI